MKKRILTEKEMINKIIGAAKSAAILEGKWFDGGDLFFTLVFRAHDELCEICKGMGIKDVYKIRENEKQ